MAQLTNLLQMVAAKSTAHEYLSFSLLLRPTNEVLDFVQLGGPGWTRTNDLGLIRGFVKNQLNSGPFSYKMPGALPPFLK